MFPLHISLLSSKAEAQYAVTVVYSRLWHVWIALFIDISELIRETLSSSLFTPALF